MMEALLATWNIYGIIALIGLGVILVLVEIFFVPGTTVVGIAGGGIAIFGVYASYSAFGSTGGHITLLSSLVIFGALLIFAFRSNTWKKAMLDTAVEGRVNVINEDQIAIGDEGIAISRLAPMGKARINNEYFEVKAMDEFIDENTSIVVKKINGNQIIVRTKST